jgi:hypothetical protein
MLVAPGRIALPNAETSGSDTIVTVMPSPVTSIRCIGAS